MDVCVMCYWGRVNDDVFETSVKTFRKHCPDALLQVYSDDIPEDIDYGIKWFKVPKADLEQGRCFVKMKCVQDAIYRFTNKDRLIVSDVDVYFLDDPFSAFDKCEFEVGVTLRCHSYKYPVNSGLFFVRPSERTEELFADQFDEYAQKYEGKQDWYIDQDYSNELYRRGYAVDVGWEYNYCPNTNVFGIQLATDMIRRAYESKSVKVLHLKSELKMAIYDGYMEDAVTRRVCNLWNWKGDAERRPKDKRWGIPVGSRGPERYRNLTRLIKENKCCSILEIGIEAGRRAIEMILAARENYGAKYYGFDLFDTVSEEVRAKEVSPSSRPRTEKAIYKLLEGAGIPIRLYAGYSRDTLPEFCKEGITPDFVFIDGGHSFKTQADDWRNVQRFMGKNTIVVFDDYLSEGEKLGWGSHRTVDAIDREKFNVEILQPADTYRMKPMNGGRRILSATNLVKVTRC